MSRWDDVQKPGVRLYMHNGDYIVRRLFNLGRLADSATDSPWRALERWQQPQTPGTYQPRSDGAFALISNWLKDCRDHHDGCRKRTSSGYPARLLEVGSQSNEPVRLVSNEIEHAQDREYAALSHCWGDPGTLVRTMSASLADHQTGISCERLSRTFNDAIGICRRLGIRYLWIDALCIIQDSAADWAAESSNMGAMYEGALLTISAVAAKDGDGGCSKSNAWTLDMRLAAGEVVSVGMRAASYPPHEDDAFGSQLKYWREPLAGRK